MNGEKRYRVELRESILIDEVDTPDHLKMVAGGTMTGDHLGFDVEADRAYIAEYGMRFYRNGVVFLILPHHIYKVISMVYGSLEKKKAAPVEPEGTV